MKTILLLIISIVLFSASFAQPTIQWQKSFGGNGSDLATSVQETIDGGYIVAGYDGSTNGDVTNYIWSYDFWIVKLNNAGTIQWQKCLGGTRGDFANSIQQTTDSGYIVAGWTFSNDTNVSGNHDTTGTYSDYWIVKINSTGIIQWQKCLGGTNNDKAYCVKQTFDGGYVLAGSALSNDGDVTGNHGNEDYWIVKLDATGNIQWQKCLGGTGEDVAFSIEQTSDSGYIAAGYTFLSYNGDVIGNHGSRDCWVVKLNDAGNLQWQKCLGGTNADAAYSIRQTSDKGYMIAGITNSNNGDVSGFHGGSGNDYWLAKIDTGGVILWQKCLGGTNDDQASSVQQANDGGYIVAGESNSVDGDVTGNHGTYDYWIVKLDSAGGMNWENSYGGSGAEGQNCIQETSDGGYIVAGASWSNNGDVSGNHDFQDYWVVKLSFAVSSQDIFSNQLPANIYPNPTTGRINISLNKNTSCKVTIYNVQGVMVYSETFIARQKTIDLQLSDGIYFIQLTNTNQTWMQKIIKN